MGLVIKISAFDRWGCTYFVQCLDEEEAKEKAYKMAKQTFSCYMPDTLEESQKEGSNIFIEVLTEIDQIIL